MITKQTREQRKYKTKRRYNSDYDDCPNHSLRNKKMANIASGYGRCWWIYHYIMANASYRAENENNRR